MSSANNYAFAQIIAGFKTQRDYTISESVYDAFVSVFNDRSPIHIDDAYACNAGFRGRVMHGGILNGFLSHFIGMHFPGSRALLLSTDVRYSKPSFLGDEIRIEAEVTQVVESHKILVMNVTFRNLTQCIPVARGRVQVGMRNE